MLSPANRHALETATTLQMIERPTETRQGGAESLFQQILAVNSDEEIIKKVTAILPEGADRHIKEMAEMAKKEWRNLLSNEKEALRFIQGIIDNFDPSEVGIIVPFIPSDEHPFPYKPGI